MYSLSDLNLTDHSVLLIWFNISEFILPQELISGYLVSYYYFLVEQSNLKSSLLFNGSWGYVVSLWSVSLNTSVN